MTRFFPKLETAAYLVTLKSHAQAAYRLGKRCPAIRAECRNTCRENTASCRFGEGGAAGKPDLAPGTRIRSGAVLAGIDARGLPTCRRGGQATPGAGSV